MPEEPTTRAFPAPLVDAVADWLIAQALDDESLERTLEGCCERLLAAGVPLWRGQIAFRTIHPLWDTVELTWYRNRPLASITYPQGESLESFQRSPYSHLIRSGLPALRRRLAGEADASEFPLLAALREQGATDYLAYVVPFGGPGVDSGQAGGVGGSWATTRPSGFSEEDVHALLRIQRRLALACKVSVNGQIAHNIATAYLGKSAGRRVLAGKIRRGDGELIHAVIWFCDLRASTRMAESLPLTQFLATVNDYFECMAGAVLDHGGEVLRFVGDAVLAIFPMEIHAVEEPARCPVHQRACRAALAAVRRALDGMNALNRRREAEHEPRLDFGIALHVGNVMYGNIGAPRRLEFSVIGAAVNYAARLEGLCKSLGRPVLLSADVAAVLAGDATPVGEFSLDGVPGAHRVFALPDAAAGADGHRLG